MELDEIIIVDSFEPRAREVQSTVEQHAAKTTTIVLSDETMEADRLAFTKKIWQLLAHQKNVMVIFNYVALARGEILEILQHLEQIHKKGTRRIYLSCRNERSLSDHVKARNIPRKKFRRIAYDEEHEKHLKKLKMLF